MAIEIGLYRDGLTKGLQMSIDYADENGDGHGYRLAGPKFSGSSSRIFVHRLSSSDADRIRQYLDLEFPVKS